MKTRLYPLDKIFDKTSNKYLSVIAISARARQISSRNSMFASEMNKAPDNRFVVEDAVKEFLNDELAFTSKPEL